LGFGFLDLALDLPGLPICRTGLVVVPSFQLSKKNPVTRTVPIASISRLEIVVWLSLFASCL
jgi:hypothetical protein